MNLFSVLVATPEEVEAGLQLFSRYQRLGSFDAVLAAVALNRQLDALVSADQAFGDVPNLPWVDPASTDLDQLLSRL
jgi:predicted nucleic acid-binding protein